MLENPLRYDLLEFCRETHLLIERSRKNYNSFYLGKINMFEVMRGKNSFVVFFNDTYLTQESREKLYYDPIAKGNNQAIRVFKQEDVKIVKSIIKSMLYNSNSI